MKNPIEVAFFQFNNQREASKINIGDEDWFTTFPKIYGENNSLIKILINDPEKLISHILWNIPRLVQSIIPQLF